MMGAGKSAVGPALAQRLECDFVDSDAEIEREAGCSIAELFAAEGEPCFRERERAAIEKLAGRPAVVALGGGAPAQPGAGEWLAATGCVVYLRARPETLLERVGDDAARPLLAVSEGESRLARLRELLERRRSAYESARWVVDTDDLAVEQVVESVAQSLGEGS